MEQVREQAKELYFEFRGAVSAAQATVGETAWSTIGLADVPYKCERDAGSYEFSMEHVFPAGDDIDGWRIPGGAAAGRERLAAWMTDNGWQVTGGEAVTTGIARTSLWASNREAGVARVQVEFISGDVQDNVNFRATSVCAPGDSLSVYTAIWNNAAGRWGPESEAPGDRPWFGGDPGDAEATIAPVEPTP